MVNKYNPQIHHRRSIRLKYYDYNQAGAYFVTICVQNRECLFGNITNQNLQLNQYGQIIDRIWHHLPNHFDNLEIDAAVIMPNHFHGILLITDRSSIVSETNRVNGNRPFYEQKTRLGQIIAYFKYQTTKLINQKRHLPGLRIWQKNYYEHIIRNEKTLAILRQYIMENPTRWDIDQLHPQNPSKW
jgi:putative transposase